MVQTILWATDGSETADTAFPFVTELAAEWSARVVVVYVIEYRAAMGGPFPASFDEESVQDKIRGQVDLLRSRGLDSELEIFATILPRTARIIAATAHECGADLVVLATRGPTPLAGLLGSQVQRLLRIAPCPVLAVPSRLAHLEVEKLLAPDTV